MKLRISDIAHKLESDIDPDKRVDALEFDKLVNRCVSVARTALGTPVGNHTEWECWHLSQILESMRHSHRTVRNLVAKGRENPESVDSLIVARAQVEYVFTVYTLLEKPEMVAVFLKDSWKKKYIRYLIEREECRNLPRFQKYLNEQALPLLEEGRKFLRISEEEKATIEAEYLGAPPPAGEHELRSFPTPKPALRGIKSPTRKALLSRLYPEYAWLCSYVHGSPDATWAKALFDKHSKYFEQFTSGQLEDVWRKEVGEKAVLLSVLSVAVCAADLVELYPADVELRTAAGEACGTLAEFSLLAKSLWERRLKSLLGVI